MNFPRERAQKIKNTEQGLRHDPHPKKTSYGDAENPHNPTTERENLLRTPTNEEAIVKRTTRKRSIETLLDSQSEHQHLKTIINSSNASRNGDPPQKKSLINIELEKMFELILEHHKARHKAKALKLTQIQQYIKKVMESRNHYEIEFQGMISALTCTRQYIAAGTTTGALKIFEKQPRKVRMVYEMKKFSPKLIADLEFNSTASLLFTSSVDQSLRVYKIEELPNRLKLTLLQDLGQLLRGLQFNRLTTFHWDRTNSRLFARIAYDYLNSDLVVFERDSEKKRFVVSQRIDRFASIRAYHVDPSGMYLVTGEQCVTPENPHRFKKWKFSENSKTFELVKNLGKETPDDPRRLFTVTSTVSGDVLYFVYEEEDVEIWSKNFVKNEHQLKALITVGASIKLKSCFCSAKGHFFGVNDSKGKIWLYKLSLSGAPKYRFFKAFHMHRSGIMDSALIQNDRYLVTSSTDKKIHISPIVDFSIQADSNVSNFYNIKLGAGLVFQSHFFTKSGRKIIAKLSYLNREKIDQKDDFFRIYERIGDDLRFRRLQDMDSKYFWCVPCHVDDSLYYFHDRSKTSLALFTQHPETGKLTRTGSLQGVEGYVTVRFFHQSRDLLVVRRTRFSVLPWSKSLKINVKRPALDKVNNQELPEENLTSVLIQDDDKLLILGTFKRTLIWAIKTKMKRSLTKKIAGVPIGRAMKHYEITLMQEIETESGSPIKGLCLAKDNRLLIVSDNSLRSVVYYRAKGTHTFKESQIIQHAGKRKEINLLMFLKTYHRKFLMTDQGPTYDKEFWVIEGTSLTKIDNFGKCFDMSVSGAPFNELSVVETLHQDQLKVFKIRDKLTVDYTYWIARIMQELFSNPHRFFDEPAMLKMDKYFTSHVSEAGKGLIFGENSEISQFGDMDENVLRGLNSRKESVKEVEQVFDGDYFIREGPKFIRRHQNEYKLLQKFNDLKYIHDRFNLPMFALISLDDDYFDRVMHLYGYHAMFYDDNYDPLDVALRLNNITSLEILADIFKQPHNARMLGFKLNLRKFVQIMKCHSEKLKSTVLAISLIDADGYVKDFPMGNSKSKIFKSHGVHFNPDLENEIKKGRNNAQGERSIPATARIFKYSFNPYLTSATANLVLEAFQEMSDTMKLTEYKFLINHMWRVNFGITLSYAIWKVLAFLLFAMHCVWFSDNLLLGMATILLNLALFFHQLIVLTFNYKMWLKNFYNYIEMYNYAVCPIISFLNILNILDTASLGITLWTNASLLIGGFNAISELRMFTATRILIFLIIQTVRDMIAFGVVLGFMLFLFSVISVNSTKSTGQNLLSRKNFFEIAQNYYIIANGEWSTEMYGDNAAQLIDFYIGGLVLFIIMMNLLIAVISLTFDQFQEKKELVNYKEIHGIMYDYSIIFSFFQGFFCSFWRRKKTGWRAADFEEGDFSFEYEGYYHCIVTPSERDKGDEIVEQLQDWIEGEVVGRVNEVDERVSGVVERVRSVEGKLDRVIELLQATRSDEEARLAALEAQRRLEAENHRRALLAERNSRGLVLKQNSSVIMPDRVRKSLTQKL